MLTLQQARQIAEDRINAMHTIGDEYELAIIDSATVEKPYAWIFFYQSKLHLETGDIMHAVGGNAPLFISKTNGQISMFPTGLSIEAMIEAYEEKLQLWTLMLAENIYSDAKKLLGLKQVLHLTNSELADYKKASRQILDIGSEGRLLRLQDALNDWNIRTQLMQQDLV